ncbi:branched-chain amino acid transporter membrane protein [Actinomadura rubrobrunea]|uniref:Branched-chain amino acid transporter membrane protein n=2 Tax=Actinomadura rubrobrunea TaxID=115335 RepID=A0A9W6UXP1_9ACTN|nr:branched-chain amino acid ABC transporter permease [Actinomadura rubrobrunea]GLW67534.1 branched-chain amino acid transporter membrane protein [Actinomadura rubrobrunea]
MSLGTLASKAAAGRADGDAPDPRPAGVRPAAVGWSLAALAVAALLVLRPHLPAGHVRLLEATFSMVTLAQAWNLVGGFCGYPFFGQVAFCGLGGYCVAVLMAKADWPFWGALCAAGLCGALAARLIGPPLLRLRRHYFAIATIGLVIALRELAVNTPWLTGGGAGVVIPVGGDGRSAGLPGSDAVYAALLLLAVAATAAAAAVSSGRSGWALRAIAQDEDGAAALGVNVARTKTRVFVLSAALTALVGGLHAADQPVLYPEATFDLEITVMVIAMVLAGGRGTVVGPLVGAAGAQLLLGFLLHAPLPHVHVLVMAVGIAVAVLLFPQGITGLVASAWRTRGAPSLSMMRRCRR